MKTIQKKNLCYVVLFVLLTLGSCQKKDDINSLKEIIPEISKIGKIHNDGLNSIGLELTRIKNGNISPTTFLKDKRLLSTTLPLSSDPTEEVRITPSIIAQSAANYVSNTAEFRGITLQQPDELVAHLSQLDADFTKSGIKNLWNNSLDEYKLKEILSEREKGLIDRIGQVLIDGANQQLSENEMYTYLSSRLQALKNEQLNIVWALNEGELFKGLIEIAISSVDYWSNLTSENILAVTSVKPNMSLFARNATSNFGNKGKLMSAIQVPSISNDLNASALGDFLLAGQALHCQIIIPQAV